MVESDKNLMVEEDNPVADERLLKIHPAYSVDI